MDLDPSGNERTIRKSGHCSVNLLSNSCFIWRKGGTHRPRLAGFNITDLTKLAMQSEM